MNISSQKQKRIDKLEARMSFIDTMLSSETLPDLDRSVYHNEKEHWKRTIDAVLRQEDY